MGKERKGKTRVTFFVPDSWAIQLKESAYLARQTVTAYIQEALVERFQKERSLKGK